MNDISLKFGVHQMCFIVSLEFILYQHLYKIKPADMLWVVLKPGARFTK